MNLTLLSFILLISFAGAKVSGQSQPILLDGITNDWSPASPSYSDSRNEGGTYDFRNFSAANDEIFLFIKISLTPFIKLLENNQISLYIDGDNNSLTGFPVNGIGAELRFGLGQREGFNYFTNSSFEHAAISFRSLPTVTDTLFEIALSRQSIPPSGGNGAIKILFADNSSFGDRMPDNGQTFTYNFDNTPTPPIQLTELSREDTSLLRVMNWNTLEDGLTDPSRVQSYTRILRAVKPDIIAFNEMWNTTALEVQAILNSILPLSSGNWNTVKLDGGNITASRYPITESRLVYPGQRITASLIDVPDRFGKDFLLINCHFKCCGGAANDATRQREADAVVAFILDAKAPGGTITLPQNTPVMITGDLNLVGDRQQLITLLTGQIINTQLFGNGGKPDWDNTDIEDEVSSQTDKRTAYTWRDDNSSYPPGRLDFQILTNSSADFRKSFVLQTGIMSQSRLQAYGLNQSDSRIASDHFPKVSDISFKTGVQSEFASEKLHFELEQNYPNPFNPSTKIKFFIPVNTQVKLSIYDVLGREVSVIMNTFLKAGSYEQTVDMTGYSGGSYFCRIEAGNEFRTMKMILIK